jgi:hypothetical protein
MRRDEKDMQHMCLTFQEAVAHVTRIGGSITETVRTRRGLRINLVHGGKPFTIVCRDGG